MNPSQQAQGAESMEFTKKQAETLLEMFGVDEAYITVVKDGDVLKAYHTDYPEEGSVELLMADPTSRSASPQPSRDARQKEVHQWCGAAFGADHASSVPQRAMRLLEEAIEAYQSATIGLPVEEMKHKAHALVDYVFSRKEGSLPQECGGVGLTLLALCEAAGISAEAQELIEIARVKSKPLEHFAKRNQAKNAAGFEVAQPSREEGERPTAEGFRGWLIREIEDADSILSHIVNDPEYQPPHDGFTFWQERRREYQAALPVLDTFLALVTTPISGTQEPPSVGTPPSPDLENVLRAMLEYVPAGIDLEKPLSSDVPSWFELCDMIRRAQPGTQEPPKDEIDWEGDLRYISDAIDDVSGRLECECKFRAPDDGPCVSCEIEKSAEIIKKLIERPSTPSERQPDAISLLEEFATIQPPYDHDGECSFCRTPEGRQHPETCPWVKAQRLTGKSAPWAITKPRVASEGAAPPQSILGIPTRVDPTMPPDEIELRSPRGSVRLTNIGVGEPATKETETK